MHVNTSTSQASCSPEKEKNTSIHYMGRNMDNFGLPILLLFLPWLKWFLLVRPTRAWPNTVILVFNLLLACSLFIDAYLNAVACS
jgi:hypothetical protein